MKPISPALAIAILAMPLAAYAQQQGEPPAGGYSGAYPNGQTGGPSSGYGGQRRGGGSITLAQFQSRMRDRMMQADTDHDGRVSLAEWTAAMEQRGGGQGDPTRMFERLDLNHDGYITPDEIDAAAARRFERMDVNHDGVITAEDLQAMHARGGYGGDGDGGGPP